MVFKSLLLLALLGARTSALPLPGTRPDAQNAPPPDPPRPAGDAVVRPRPAPVGEDTVDYQKRKEKAKFSFEFSKAEILDVVKAISDMTRQNFIIPERIKGQRVTILSPTKITASEAYQVFYNALSSNGISIVRSGKFYKLVDGKDAIKDTIPTCIGDEGDCALAQEQMVTTLVRLRYADAAQITAVAKSLMSKDGDISVFPPSNALIISEYAPNLKRVRRIIDALDVPGFDDELQLVQIQYTSAQEIADKLTQIFDVQSGANHAAGSNARRGPRPGEPVNGIMPPGIPGSAPQPAGGDDSADVQISKIVPDDRTGQIIIKANRRSFDAIKNLIAKLDVPVSETEQGRVHVYYLENAKAEELASTLSSLSGGGGNKQGARSGAPPVPGQSGAARGAETASLFEGEVKLTADKATNSLLIMAGAHDYRAVRNLIEKLDMPRRQVYVETAILEVNIQDNQDEQVNWHSPIRFGANDLGGLANVPGATGPTFGFLQSSTGSSAVSPTLTALVNNTSLISAAGGSLGGIIGQALTIPMGDGSLLEIPTFGIILKWLQTTSNANILSTPHILTTDNEQAKIEVGEKIPFNSGVFGGGLGGLSSLAGGSTGTAGAAAGLGALGALGGGLGGLTSQVQRIDVSLKLTLTPQINERNKIRLEIEQTVEDVVGDSQKSSTPTTAHRSIKTVVVVDDQQTVVLGGLMRDRVTESDSKIPILGDLPIIGLFFKQHSTKAQKVNLLLVLTPYIISSPYDFQRIFERRLEEHEEFSAEYFGHRQEYRAFIDYTKKTGPLGKLVATYQRESSRVENGGRGDGSEVLIGPDPNDDREDAGPNDPLHIDTTPEPDEPGTHSPGALNGHHKGGRKQAPRHLRANGGQEVGPTRQAPPMINAADKEPLPAAPLHYKDAPARDGDEAPATPVPDAAPTPAPSTPEVSPAPAPAVEGTP